MPSAGFIGVGTQARRGRRGGVLITTDFALVQEDILPGIALNAGCALVRSPPSELTA